MGNVCCVSDVLLRDKANTIDKDEREELIKDEMYETRANSKHKKSNSNSNSNSNTIYDMDVLLEAFEDSVKTRDYDNAMALMEEYSNVDFINHEFGNGDKVLHYAIKYKDSKFTYFILQKGADPNVKSAVTGDTPLHIATRNEDASMITLLMKWKASIEIRNNNDKTAYHIAMNINNSDILDIFDEVFQKYMEQRKSNAKPKNNAAQDAFSNDINMELNQTIEIISDEEMQEPNDNDDIPDYRSETSGVTDVDEYTHDLSISSVSADDNDDDDTFDADDAKDEQKDNIVTNNPNDLRSKMKKKKSQKIIETITKVDNEQDRLPRLGAWMEKRRPKPPHMYQKRYACVVDGHLLWNDKRVHISPGVRIDSTERKKFGGSLSLMMIKNVAIHESKKKNTWKFKIILRENAVVNKKKGKKNKLKDRSERVYIWKCYSKEARNEWVDGLTTHLKYLKRTLKRLDQLD